jgi:hypothetical protein
MEHNNENSSGYWKMGSSGQWSGLQIVHGVGNCQLSLALEPFGWTAAMSADAPESRARILQRGVVVIVSVCLLALMYSLTSAPEDPDTAAGVASVDRGAVCLIFESTPGTVGTTPKVDLSWAGKGFVRYINPPSSNGAKSCNKLSVESYSPLTARVYSMTDENREKDIASESDSPVTTDSIEIPSDGEVCIYISPLDSRSDNEPEWSISVVTHPRRNFIQTVLRLVTLDTDVCASDAK